MLLLTQNDRFHRRIEQDLGAGKVVPWLQEAGIDVTATNDVGVMSAPVLAGYLVFMPWLMPQWDAATGAHTRLDRTASEAVGQFVHHGGGLFGLHGATVVWQVEPYASYVNVLSIRW